MHIIDLNEAFYVILKMHLRRRMGQVLLVKEVKKKMGLETLSGIPCLRRDRVSVFGVSYTKSSTPLM